MSGVPMIAWIVLALWSAVIVYVFVNVRSVMANNNKAIARVFGNCPFGITDRAVLINRIALVVLLVVSDWAILRYAGTIPS